MLVLSRKENESVIIPMDDGNQIEVMVVEVRGDKVRLGFSAPRGVPIHREEVWIAIQQAGIDKAAAI